MWTHVSKSFILSALLPVHLHCALSIIGRVKKWPQQWPRQCHKSMIWLVQWGKIIMLHVWHAIVCNFLTYCLKQFSFLRFRQQCEPAAVKLSFILCFSIKTIKICAKQEKCTSPFCTLWTTWNHCKTLNLMQSSTLLMHMMFLLQLPS